MARTPNYFIDPKTGHQYQWPLNHSSEEAVGKSRQMSDGAATDNIGLIPQQGSASPLILNWKGRILTYAQLTAMLGWWELCEAQSVYVQSYSGSRYEVIITDFQPQVVAVAQNRHDPVNAPTWVWDYTLTMRVLRSLRGEWVGVTP